MDPADTHRLKEDGFAVIERVLGGDLLAAIRAECASIPSAGLRNATRHYKRCREAACSPPVLGLARGALGASPILTRVIVFDKSPGANWSLSFHQDTAIAVEERHDVAGFGPWSVKAGVPHVQPPAAVLEAMVTVRLHLDDCGESNGPLDVIPRSHRRGMLDDAEIARLVAAGPVVRCMCRAGDAVLMRPLLLHGSRRAEIPGHRRVLHLEFAGAPLPLPLRWAAT